MAESEKLGKLRAKLREITEHVDNADQRKTDAKHKKVEASATLEKNETEDSSAKRRIKLLERDLDDATERLALAEEKLKKATDTTDEVEVSREELEKTEAEDDEKIQKFEQDIKELKRTLEMSETKYNEYQRKKTVCCRDIEKVSEKADAFEKRVALLEETIQNHGKSLEELELKDGEAGDREELNEEKMVFLEGQLKETVVRAEAAERGCAVAERNILETENEINSWIQKREEIEREMIEMDDVADDPAYQMAPLDHGDDSKIDDGRITPSKIKEKPGIFSETSGGSRPGSRPGSRASSKPEVSKQEESADELSSAPETEEAPGPEEAKKEGEEEDYFGSKSSGLNEAGTTEKAKEISTEEESGGESEDDDYFK